MKILILSMLLLFVVNAVYVIYSLYRENCGVSEQDSWSITSKIVAFISLAIIGAITLALSIVNNLDAITSLILHK